MGGTFGLGFHPNIKKDETLRVSKQEAFRSLTYKCSDLGLQESQFDNIDKYTFVDDGAAWKQFNQPGYDNLYDIKYDGSINVTNAYIAESLYTKAHFLDLNDTSLIPVVKDHDGTVIRPNHDIDSTFYDVEPFTGMNLKSRESYQISFMW